MCNDFYNYCYPDYLMHYGVKGMKWGHRKRYYDSNGNLNARGIKKYARAGYAQDSYNSNKTIRGKVYDKITNAHKYGGDMMYDMSSKKANKARAEKYLADKQAKKEAANTPEAKAARKAKMKKAAKVGAAVVATSVLAVYGTKKVHEYCNNYLAKKEIFEESVRRLTNEGIGVATVNRATVNRATIPRAQLNIDPNNPFQDTFGKIRRNL